MIPYYLIFYLLSLTVICNYIDFRSHFHCFIISSDNFLDLLKVLRIAFRKLPYSLLRRCMLVSKGWRKIALDELGARCSVSISEEDHVHIVLKRLRTNRSFRVGKCQITGVAGIGVSLDNFFLDQVFCRVANTLHHLKVESHVGILESNLFALLVKLPNLAQLSVTFLPVLSRTGNHHTESNGEEQYLHYPCLGGRNSGIKSGGDEQSLDFVGSSGKNETSKEFSIPVHRNIRHLHLEMGQNVTFQLSKVFQVFPALVELAITNLTDESRKHFRERKCPMVPLKHLMLRQYSNVGFPEKLVHTLMRFNMHLEKLAVVCHPPPPQFLSMSQQQQQPSSSSSSLQSKTTPAPLPPPPLSCSLLKQFIESLGSSLKSLKLVQVEDDVECNWNVVNSKGDNYYHWNFNYSSTPSSSNTLLPMTLPNLEALHVQKPQITNLAQVLNHFAKLEQVSIQVSRQGLNWKGMLPARLQPHENIKKLEIDFIDSDSFSWLGYCFPSLQTLQLGFCDQSLFSVLCKLIPYFNSNIASKTLVSCQVCHGISHEFTAEKNSSDEPYDPDHHHLDDEDIHGTENKEVRHNESSNKETFSRKPRRKDTGVGNRVPAPSPRRNSFPQESINSNNFSLSFHHNQNGEGEQCHTRNFPGKQVNSPGMIQLETVHELGIGKIQKRKHHFKNLKLLRVRPCYHLPFEDFVFLQGHRDAGTNQSISMKSCNDDEPLSESPVGFSWTMLSSTMKDERFEDFLGNSSDGVFDETCSTA